MLIFIKCVTSVFVVASQVNSDALKMHACMVVRALDILVVESIVFAHPDILDGIAKVSVCECVHDACVYASVPACVTYLCVCMWLYECVCMYVSMYK